jgi:3-methyladenine DNA glycosylase AlkC
VTQALKHLLGEEAVRWLADSLRAAHPDFPSEAFVRSCLIGLEALELKQRAWHLAEAMFQHLPKDYPAAAEIVLTSLGPEIEPTGETGLNVLHYLPHDCFIQKYGIDHFEVSTQVQYELTRRSSCEFSLRAFIEKYPDSTYALLLNWAHDENAHVRRLVSEGTRPRLPWAPRLRGFQKDPKPVLALLELLKDDPVHYVQRSVANNLNDIAKDHPDLTASICKQWIVGAGPGRKWIVSHALRSLVKQGHAGALKIMGAGSKPKIRISGVRLSPKRLKIGGQLHFSFNLTSASRRSQDLLIDYSIHFMKSNGASRPKVFKLKKILLLADHSQTLVGTVSFTDMTTRKHYPGKHRIDAHINGKTFLLGYFKVVA